MVRVDIPEGNSIRHEYWTDAMYSIKDSVKDNPKFSPAPFAVLYTYPAL